MAKRGDLVEFNSLSDEREEIVAGGEGAEYGVCLEDEVGAGHAITVYDTNGDTVRIPSRWIVAEGWLGWCPPELEEKWNEIQNEVYPFEDGGY